MRPASFLFFILLAAACRPHVQTRQTLLKTPAEATVSIYNIPWSDSAHEAEVTKKRLALLATLKPITGYRFVVKGDFDGDGNKEVLTEHFWSTVEGKETNKFYESLDYGDYQILNYLKGINAFASCSNLGIDTIRGTGRLGLLLLKNEGDLDEDGGDELTLVRDNADYSSCNHCELLSYKQHKWRVLYSFDIWDWQIPPLPQAATLYGLFGSYDVAVSPGDSIDRLLEKQLQSFGFIEKLHNGKIRVTYRSKESNERTRIVDMRKLKGRPYK